VEIKTPPLDQGRSRAGNHTLQIGGGKTSVPIPDIVRAFGLIYKISNPAPKVNRESENN